MQASAKEIRLKTKKILDAVQRGEEVIVTYRGRKRAKIIPLVEETRLPLAADENPLFGLWRDREDILNIADHVRSLRQDRLPKR